MILNNGREFRGTRGTMCGFFMGLVLGFTGDNVRIYRGQWIYEGAVCAFIRGQRVDLGGGAMCGFPIYRGQCVDLRGPVCGFMRGKCVNL